MKESEKMYEEYKRLQAEHASMNVLDSRNTEVAEQMDWFYNESVRLENEGQ